jgi:hypothetical protein
MLYTNEAAGRRGVRSTGPPPQVIRATVAVLCWVFSSLPKPPSFAYVIHILLNGPMLGSSVAVLSASVHVRTPPVGCVCVVGLCAVLSLGPLGHVNCGLCARFKYALCCPCHNRGLLHKSTHVLCQYHMDAFVMRRNDQAYQPTSCAVPAFFGWIGLCLPLMFSPRKW